MAISAQYKQKIWLVLLATLALRMIAMWLIPLTDTTEARYGEIARKMLETNNWVTPLHDYNASYETCAEIACVKLPGHDYGVPFWAKPPLSTWTSAASMKVLGVNEFAARLPSLLFSLGLLALIYSWLKQRPNDLNLVAVTVLSTSLLFCGAAGLVMTDLALIFCSTLGMVSFWQAVVENKGKLWGYLFFFSLGLGLLAKGPLILVLVGLPTGVWTLAHFQLLNVWKRLPWITGLTLACLIAGPWYYLAELRTPGFIQYFIVGEHFSRFLISGWSGDHYGHAHSEPLGMIWLYLFAGFLPWFGLVVVKLVKHKAEIRWRYPIADSWLSYLILWSVMPVIFFTFAHNIISPYALPAMPACAILFAELFVRFKNQQQQLNAKPILGLALVTPVVFIVLLVIYLALPDLATKRSEKDLAKVYLDLRKDEHSQLIYFRERLYSAEFYTGGKARVVEDNADIARLFGNDTLDFVAVNGARYHDAELQKILATHFKKVATQHGIALYQECVEEAPCQP